LDVYRLEFLNLGCQIVRLLTPLRFDVGALGVGL
jgi:hypothetical protein